MARRIRYLRGKMQIQRTTMVSVENPSGGITDIPEKKAMEKAIMDNNEKKFKQSLHRPFYKEPLSTMFGFKGITTTAAMVLADVFSPDQQIPSHEDLLLRYLTMPEEIHKFKELFPTMSIYTYRKFWLKAQKNTSAYPDALSFSTMKAGATSSLIAEIECRLTRIPINTGFSPSRWTRCLNVMIVKKSGRTMLNGL